ncbi:MAG: ABC transporter substrate-binding protein [Pseudonocardiaceae bacterium]|nr:ABC transporter substrate-binding protein [Pseudonocardiaceae bacterium]
MRSSLRPPGHRGAAVAVALVASFGLAACGQSTDPSTGGAQPAKAKQLGSFTPCGPKAEIPLPDTMNIQTVGKFPREVNSAMRKTSIKNRPQTVAALDSSYVDAALALGAKVIAYTRFPGCGNELPKYLGSDSKRLAGDAQPVGELDTPDLDKLHQIQPDLIVSAKIRHEKIHDQLSGVAPTVFSETTGATWKDNLRLLGNALGKEQLAEARIKNYEERARKVGAAIRTKVGHNPTVSLVRFVGGESTVRLYSSASYPGIVLDDTGLARPKGQPNPSDDIAAEISQENILKLDADAIFVSTFADPENQSQQVRNDFEKNPLWGKLKGEKLTVSDVSWGTSVSLQGAHGMLDDLAKHFGVDPARG